MAILLAAQLKHGTNGRLPPAAGVHMLIISKLLSEMSQHLTCILQAPGGTFPPRVPRYPIFTYPNNRVMHARHPHAHAFKFGIKHYSSNMSGMHACKAPACICAVSDQRPILPVKANDMALRSAGHSKQLGTMSLCT